MNKKGIAPHQSRNNNNGFGHTRYSTDANPTWFSKNGLSKSNKTQNLPGFDQQKYINIEDMNEDCV